MLLLSGGLLIRWRRCHLSPGMVYPSDADALAFQSDGKAPKQSFSYNSMLCFRGLLIGAT